MTCVTPLIYQRARVVLASRVNGGIHVSLLWAADTNTATVSVWDGLTDDRFELVVERDVNPVDVYDHPYAYAAWRGVDYLTAPVQEAA